MNIIDIIIIVTVALGFGIGWKIRAINLLSILLALTAGIIMANRVHSHFMDLYRDFPPTLQPTLGWLTAFLIAAVTVAIVGGLIAKAFEVIRLQWLDHLIGALLALSVALGLLLIGITILDNLARTYRWSVIEHSIFAPPLLKVGEPLLHQGFKKLPKLKQQFPSH